MAQQAEAEKPERLGIGPDEPLSEGELELLARLNGEGMPVAGLVLVQRDDERVFVEGYAPPTSTQQAKLLTDAQPAGLSLEQLGSGARLLFDQGQYGLAATAFALCVRLNALHRGPEHADTLTSANNLAETLRAQGDLLGARSFQESVLESRQRVLGPEHPDTLTSASNLAPTLWAQGDLNGARRIHESVFETRQRMLGPEHPDTLTSAGNLAATLSDQGNLAGARRIQESVFESRKRLLGDEHPDTLTSANNLAGTLSAQSDLAGARRIQESVFETHQRVLGPEHPATLTSANNMAATMLAQGDLASARRIYEWEFEANQRLLGPKHPATLTSANNLAQTLLSLNDHAACAELCVSSVKTLCQAGVTSQVAFNTAGNQPLLSSPSLPWPAETLARFSALLPDFSKLLTARLEVMPLESWSTVQPQFERMHQQWLAYAMHHALGQILPVLGALHGLRSWSLLQADVAEVRAAASQDDSPRSRAAAEYLAAREALSTMRAHPRSEVR